MTALPDDTSAAWRDLVLRAEVAVMFEGLMEADPDAYVGGFHIPHWTDWGPFKRLIDRLHKREIRRLCPRPPRPVDDAPRQCGECGATYVKANRFGPSKYCSVKCQSKVRNRNFREKHRAKAGAA